MVDSNKFAMTVDVLRNANGDYTNGGLTGKHTSVLLIGPGGAPDSYDTKKSKMPVFRVVARTFGGEPYYHAEPDEEFRPAGCVGPMSGGNFLYSGDSRFRKMFPYPIPAHDRFETPALYAALST